MLQNPDHHILKERKKYKKIWLNQNPQEKQ